MKVVKNVAFHVPIIPIGELDDYGKDLLDFMLAKGDMINDIVEFFKNYEPQPGRAFKKAEQAEVVGDREVDYIIDRSEGRKHNDRRKQCYRKF